MTADELADYGQARVRDIAFDAVHQLWLRRSAEGLKQSDLAVALGRDPAWVSRNLRGPANWTFRTFGSLVAALNGEIEINVAGKDDKSGDVPNHRAYDDFERDAGSNVNEPKSTAVRKRRRKTA